MLIALRFTWSKTCVAQVALRFTKKRKNAHLCLLGNSKGPVELGNPNICAEVKLCLFMPVRNSLPRD